MLKKILYFVFFIISLILVIQGNNISGYAGIMMMLIGLVICLSELYFFNKRYQ